MQPQVAKEAHVLGVAGPLGEALVIDRAVTLRRAACDEITIDAVPAAQAVLHLICGAVLDGAQPGSAYGFPIVRMERFEPSHAHDFRLALTGELAPSGEVRGDEAASVGGPDNL